MKVCCQILHIKWYIAEVDCDKDTQLNKVKEHRKDLQLLSQKEHKVKLHKSLHSSKR